MKREMSLAIVFILSFSWGWLAAQDRDLAAVKRVVQKEGDAVPAQASGQPAKWLKIRITDRRGNQEEKMSMSVPLRVVELVLKHDRDKKLRVFCDHHEIDLAALLEELKTLSPGDLIEFMDEDEIIRIWLE